MKKSLFAFVAGLLLLSCNQTKDSTATADDNIRKDDLAAITKRNGEMTRKVYEAIITGDVSKLGDYVTTDVIDHEGNMGRDIVGLDSLKHFMAQYHNHVEGMKIEVLSEATSPDGQYHFSMTRMTGKMRENPWGMPVGTQMDDSGIDVIKIRDGKAAEHWSFTSQKDMMEMMSAMQGSDMAKHSQDSTKR